MKKPFEVGEKVAVYNGMCRSIGTVKFTSPDTVTIGVVIHEVNNVIWFHPKQCRRLKPKKKFKYGKELWFGRNKSFDTGSQQWINENWVLINHTVLDLYAETVHVREILD